MADKTHIQWTDATWNPITGCSIVSKGCANCYAMQLAGTRLRDHSSRQGLTHQVNGNHVWTGDVRFNEQWLTQPLTWSKPRRIFVCAHGDLFHENVPDEWIDRVFAVMALAPRHTFQVLTKRPERMRKYLAPFDSRRADGLGTNVITLGFKGSLETLPWPLPNVWLGVSVEDQTTANERVPLLVAAPAAVRFISAEPLLGPIDLTDVDIDGYSTMNALKGYSWREVWESDWAPESTGVSLDEAKEAYIEEGGVWPPTDSRAHMLGWVIVGGESGAKARPMHPDWARSLRDQCAKAGVPFFFKQWGEWAPVDAGAVGRNPGAEIQTSDELHRLGKKAAGDLLDGVQHHNWPEVRS